MIGVLKRHLTLYGLSVAVLAAAFMFNIFGVQSMEWFSGFQKDSDALVVHKLACQDELGRDAFGGMMVTALKHPEQFSIDDKNPTCQKNIAMAYVSQFGLQGKITGVVYNVTHKLPGMTLKHFLALMQIIWAVLSAAVLALFVIWVAERFGRFSAVTVLLLLGMSVWIVGFARNLYWAMPLLFLPLIFTLFYYSRPGRTKRYVFFLSGLFLLFLAKFLCGYEFVPEVILSAVVAAGFLLFERNSGFMQLVKEGLVICLVGLAAFIGALGMNYYQVYHYVGNAAEARHMIRERILLRTTESGGYRQYVYSGLAYTVPAAYTALDNYLDLKKAEQTKPLVLTNVLSVLNYALLPVVNIPLSIHEPVYTLLSSFVFVAVLAFLAVRSLRKRATRNDDVSYGALWRALWLGLISSVSWLVLAYSHSLVHAHLNGIIFYLPFLLFAYVAIALWLERQFSIVKSYIPKTKPGK